MKDTEQAQGQYLYAIIACAEPREFKARGIGEHGDVVHTMNYRRSRRSSAIPPTSNMKIAAAT